MAFNSTTLSAAITATQTVFGVASATGIVNPVTQANLLGSTPALTYLLIEQELMFVTNVTGTTVTVLRSQGGTQANAHGSAAPVLAGAPTDFINFTPAVGATSDTVPANANQGFSAPVAGANTNTATGLYFHLTGSTIMKTLNPPVSPAYLEGCPIVIVFDGSAAGLTWDATGNINVAGTATTAGSSVSFVFDSSISKWIPSRLA